MEPKPYKPTTTLFVVAMVMGVPSVPWYGFVMTKLWLWFVVPFGLPAIGMWWALGLMVTLRFFVMMRGPAPAPSEEAYIGEHIARPVFVPAFVLGLGAMMHGLMT